MSVREDLNLKHSCVLLSATEATARLCWFGALVLAVTFIATVEASTRLRWGRTILLHVAFFAALSIMSVSSRMQDDIASLI